MFNLVSGYDGPAKSIHKSHHHKLYFLSFQEQKNNTLSYLPFKHSLGREMWPLKQWEGYHLK